MALTVTSVDEWQDLTSASFASLRCYPTGTGFEGSIDTRVLAGGLSLSRVESSSLVIGRPASLVRDLPSDDVLMTLQLGATGRLVQHDRCAVLTPGSAAVFEARAEYEIDNSVGEQEQIVLRIARNALGLNDALLTDSCARVIRANDPLLRVLIGTTVSVFGELPAVDAPARVGFEALLLDFVATVLRRSAPSTEVPRRPAAEQVVRYVEAHLDEPDLDVPRLAAAHFVSARTVYEIFAEYGDTPARVIRARRLKRAESLLLRGEQVGVVALACGFGAVDTFIRVFRRAHGVTPAVWAAGRRVDR